MNIRIGELARRTGCAIATIRYYETEGLLPPPARSDGNYRQYGPAHVERLHFIRHCRSLDMSLAEVRTLLRYRDQPSQQCGEVNALVDAHIEEVEARVHALLQLKQHLLALRSQCAEARSAAACGILQGLADSTSFDALPQDADAAALHCRVSAAG